MSRFRLTIVHPCVGRKPGQQYIRTWQMEPLAPAVLAALTPGDVEVRFYDDRMEPVPFDEPTDLVAVRTALQDAGIDYDSAESGFQPSVSVQVDLDGARKVLKLIDALEENDDVQDVYTNIDIPDDVAAQLDED